MSIRKRAIFALLTAATITAIFSFGAAPIAEGGPPGFKPSPVFKGDTLAVPPKQDEPWQPPETALPEKLIAAVRLLFEQGFGDPRGCEYREIEIGTGNCWRGDGGVVKVNGWVLPEKHDGRVFAVAWNGLVYPVVSAGAAADLDADVKALIAADEKRRADYADDYPDRTFMRWPNHAFEESRGASHKTLFAVKVAHLLRLGRADLAEATWACWSAGMQRDNNKKELEHPYYSLAKDWIWSLFDRAVCCFMRGDDRLGLQSARKASDAGFQVEKEFEKQGLDKKFYNFALSRNRRCFDFLGNIEELKLDLERRVSEGPRRTALEIGLKNIPEQEERIKLLIRDLDGVASRQSGQPGGVSLLDDPVSMALLKEGEAAADALLDCFVNDRRLTRAVSFHRDFFRSRQTHKAGDAAYRILCSIFRKNFGTALRKERQETPTREQIAGEIESYLNKFGEMSPAERWYTILKDDFAGEDEWMEAASNITGKADSPDAFGAAWITVTERMPGEKPKLKGDELRDSREPSVRALLEKRVFDITDAVISLLDGRLRREFTYTEALRLKTACNMAAKLSRWNESAAPPVMKKLLGIMVKAFPLGPGKTTWEAIARENLYLTTFVQVSGDSSVLAQYADFLMSCGPTGLRYNVAVLYKPFWYAPESPDTDRIVDWLREAGKRGVEPFEKSERSESRHWLNLVDSYMLGINKFRERVLEELDNRTVIGEAEVKDKWDTYFHPETGTRQKFSSRIIDPRRPPKGSVNEVRMCDYIARLLAGVEGMPFFALYWAEDDRDAAIKRTIDSLRRFGKWYVPANLDNPALPSRSYPDFDLRLNLVRPGACATDEDVLSGDAVFSLEGNAKKRLLDIGDFPVKAKWTTLEDYPFVGRYRMEGDTRVPVIIYRNKGRIMQAEEILDDGKWEQYYGFIGRYNIAKVPGAEIEFDIDGFKWFTLSDGISGSVLLPEGRRLHKESATYLAEEGKTTFVLVLKNRSGLNKTVPETIEREGGLLAGVDIELAHVVQDAFRDIGKPREKRDAYDALEWRMPDSSGIKRFIDGGMIVLSPNTERVVAEIALSDYFELPKGTYRLKFTFSSEKGFVADGESLTYYFALGYDKGVD